MVTGVVTTVVVGVVEVCSDVVITDSTLTGVLEDKLDACPFPSSSFFSELRNASFTPSVSFPDPSPSKVSVRVVLASPTIGSSRFPFPSCWFATSTDEFEGTLLVSFVGGVDCGGCRSC